MATGALTNYGATIYLDHLLGGNSKAAHTPYLGAFLTTPTVQGPGTEPAGQGYNRVACAEDTFTNSTIGEIQSALDIVFPMATGNWGQIVGFGLFDSSVGGNCYAFYHSEDVELIETNDKLVVLAGGLSHTLTGTLWSNLVKNHILNDLYNFTPIPTYPTVYCAAFATAPTPTAGGTEPVGNGYVRQAVANSAVNFSPTSGNYKFNSTAVEFPEATADWGVMTHYGWFDADTGGQFLLGGVLTDSAYMPMSKTIAAQDILHLPAASLRHQIVAV